MIMSRLEVTGEMVIHGCSTFFLPKHPEQVKLTPVKNRGFLGKCFRDGEERRVMCIF